MYLSSIVAGLYSIFKVHRGHATWIRSQVLGGFGAGFSMETPWAAANTVLSTKEAGISISLVTFFQLFESSIFLAAARTVFSSTLTSELAKKVLQIDVATFTHLGTSAVRSFGTQEGLPLVLAAYNKTITTTFHIATGASACKFFAVSLLVWRSLKRKD